MNIKQPKLKLFDYTVEYRGTGNTRRITGQYRTGRALTLKWVLAQLRKAHPDAHGIEVRVPSSRT